MFRFLKNLALFIILAAVAIAILRIFGWDPFSFINFVIDLLWSIIDSISRWLEDTAMADFFRR